MAPPGDGQGAFLLPVPGMLAIGERVVDQDVANLVAVLLSSARLLALVLVAVQVSAASLLALHLKL